MRERLKALWERIPDLPAETEPLSPVRKLILIGIIFLLASLFRYVHYLDLAPLVSVGQQDFSGTTAIHDGMASNILKDGIEAIFPSNWTQISDTSLIQYPPGYGLLQAAVYSINGRNPAGVQFVQGLFDAIAAVLVFLIVLELFNRTVAVITGIAVAISHHLAYYSLLLLPDGVAPVFVMAGTLLLIRGIKIGWDKEKGYWELVGTGIFYGLSCWLRASAMLLWVFWAVLFFLTRRYMVQPVQRALTLAITMAVVIAPLTIRNYHIYGEFIPVSLGSGILLQEGLGEADPSLGFPFKDDDTMRWEAKLYKKPEYETGLMTPDGIFREKERRRRSMKVIIDRPFWYLTVMAGRLDLMTKYSAHAPLIRKELPQKGLKPLSQYEAEYGSFSGLLHYYNDYGSAIDYLRPLMRTMQRIFKEGLFPLLVIGVIVGLKDRRRWLLLMTVPIYYLSLHSLMHAEFRYVLPCHYLLFAFYGLAFHTLLIALPRRARDSFRLPAYAGEIGTEHFEQIKVGQPALNQVVATTEAQALGAGVMGVAPAGDISRERVDIMGINIDNTTQSETIRLIDSFVAAREPRMMAVVNASKLVLAREDDELKRILLGADIVTADGMSVVWASRFLGRPLKERVTGIDTFERVISLAARRGYSVYFLGAKPEVVEAVARHYQGRYADLKIAGHHNGYFGRSEDVIAEIERARPDILCVAMGSPRQEKWMAANLRVLNVPFSIGVGGSFDHVTGFARRAPQWMQKVGLEWLYRLLQEPRRLWRRYLIGNTLFVWLVVKERFKR
jgi:N-acetylglucosaminyldiphosphoundecaprenol N-acetyl-beta-D-mannosaminyltransferase